MKTNHGIIRTNYELILPHFNSEGRLCSLVVTDHGTYRMDKEPLQIIQDSTTYYGGSLSGVLHGAKMALGNIHLPPVQICSKQGMYWFPTQCFTNKENIWISYPHIREIRKIDKKNTELIMRSGFRIPIPIGIHRMQKRISNTHCYKQIIESRTSQGAITTRNDSRITYDPNRNHFDLEE